MKTSYPKEKITAVLLEGVHPHGAAMLEREGFKVRTFAKALEGAALEKAIADAHLVGIRSKTALTQEVLAKAPRLLAAGCFCIGTNQVDLACAASRGIAVFNSPFSNTRSVAELTIAEAVALHRRLVDKTREMHAGMWDKSAEGAHEVRGRTIGIVGYGHIGTQVSILAEAMGMRVMYFDIVPKLPLGNARACKSLNELLEQCDVLTLHVPATSRTKNMIGKAELARMKQGSYVINNARGSVVELGALAAALKSGKVAGAALDVFPEEPAGRGDPFESPVRGLPNVILTPHIGGEHRTGAGEHRGRRVHEAAAVRERGNHDGSGERAAGRAARPAHGRSEAVAAAPDSALPQERAGRPECDPPHDRGTRREHHGRVSADGPRVRIRGARHRPEQCRGDREAAQGAG